MMKKSGLAVMVTLTLVFSLALAVTSAQAETYLDSVMVAGTKIQNGEYYTANPSGGLTKIDKSSANPTDSYVTYDSSTGTLTLNRITINATGDTVAGFGISIETSTPFALTIKLAGESSIDADKSGVEAYKGDITITSDMQESSLVIISKEGGCVSIL